MPDPAGPLPRRRCRGDRRRLPPRQARLVQLESRLAEQATRLGAAGRSPVTGRRDHNRRPGGFRHHRRRTGGEPERGGVAAAGRGRWGRRRRRHGVWPWLVRCSWPRPIRAGANPRCVYAGSCATPGEPAAWWSASTACADAAGAAPPDESGLLDLKRLYWNLRRFRTGRRGGRRPTNCWGWIWRAWAGGSCSSCHLNNYDNNCPARDCGVSRSRGRGFAAERQLSSDGSDGPIS